VRSKTKRGTIELREYLQLVEEGQLDDEERFNDVVQWDRDSGVSVIASEATSNQSFTAHSFMKGLRRAKQNSHSVFCDLGNGIMREANIGSVHMADTLVFPGNVNMADSLDDISNTKMRYADLGVPQKVQNGIVVIVGARLRDREKYAERFDNPVERTFVVPFNRYMKQGKPVSIPKLPRRIRVILKEILVAIVKAERGQDAGINELIDHAHDYLHI
jgi:hypothetical protein